MRCSLPDNWVDAVHEHFRYEWPVWYSDGFMVDTTHWVDGDLS